MPATLCTSSGFSRTQSAPSEQSTASLYNEAVKFHRAGLLQDAENKFRQALLRNKRHVPSLVGLGSLLKEKGDIQGGSKYLLEASGEISAPADSSSLGTRAQTVGRFKKNSSIFGDVFTRASSAEKGKTLKSVSQAVAASIQTLKMSKLYLGSMKTEGNHFALSNKAQGPDGTGGSVPSSSEPQRREHVVVDIFTRTSSAPPTLTLAMASLAKVGKDPVHPPATAPAENSNPVSKKTPGLTFEKPSSAPYPVGGLSQGVESPPKKFTWKPCAERSELMSKLADVECLATGQNNQLLKCVE